MLYEVITRFGEDSVGTGFEAGLGTFHRGVQTLLLEGVGTGDNEEIVIGLGIDGGLDAVDHLLEGDDSYNFV